MQIKNIYSFLLILFYSPLLFASESINNSCNDVKLKTSAAHNDKQAQYTLGICIIQGKIKSTRDKEQGIFWLRKAADQKHSEALVAIGHCYLMGKGVEENREKALSYYQRAAEMNNAWGQYYLAKEITNDNSEKAATLYRQAAEQGHVSAQYEYGNCLEYGSGVKQNKNLANYWYSRAAEQGYDLTKHYNINLLDIM